MGNKQAKEASDSTDQDQATIEDTYFRNIEEVKRVDLMVTPGPEGLEECTLLGLEFGDTDGSDKWGLRVTALNQQGKSLKSSDDIKSIQTYPGRTKITFVQHNGSKTTFGLGDAAFIDRQPVAMVRGLEQIEEHLKTCKTQRVLNEDQLGPVEGDGDTDSSTTEENSCSVTEDNSSAATEPELRHGLPRPVLGLASHGQDRPVLTLASHFQETKPSCNQPAGTGLPPPMPPMSTPNVGILETAIVIEPATSSQSQNQSTNDASEQERTPTQPMEKLRLDLEASASNSDNNEVSNKTSGSDGSEEEAQSAVPSVRNVTPAKRTRKRMNGPLPIPDIAAMRKIANTKVLKEKAKNGSEVAKKALQFQSGHENRRLASTDSMMENGLSFVCFLPLLLILLVLIFKRFSQSCSKNDEQNHDHDQEAEVDNNIV